MQSLSYVYVLFQVVNEIYFIYSEWRGKYSEHRVVELQVVAYKGSKTTENY